MDHHHQQSSQPVIIFRDLAHYNSNNNSNSTAGAGTDGCCQRESAAIPTTTATTSSTTMTSSSSSISSSSSSLHNDQHRGRRLYFYKKLLYVPLFALLNIIIITMLLIPLQRRLNISLFGLSGSLENVKSVLGVLTDDAVWRSDGWMIMMLYAAVYIFNQTFCVPGSIVMNVLAGAMLGTWMGLPVVALLTASGASSAYMLSKLVGKEFFWEQKMFTRRLTQFQRMINASSRTHLFVILVALRIFPFTPNFFVNLAAPIVDIPLWMFYPSVFIGLLPFHYVTVSAGQFIRELQSTRDIYEPQTIAFLVFLSLVMIAPMLLQRTAAVQRFLNVDPAASQQQQAATNNDNSSNNITAAANGQYNPKQH